MVQIDTRKLEIGDAFTCPVTKIEQKVISKNNNFIYTKDKNGIIRSAILK